MGKSSGACLTTQECLQEIIKLVKKSRSKRVRAALLWAANEAICMSGGGHPDGYLMGTPEEKEIERLCR